MVVFTSRQNKCWQVSFYKTTGKLKFVLSKCCYFTFLEVQFLFSSCHYGLLMIWLGLSTRNTWLGSRRHFKTSFDLNWSQKKHLDVSSVLINKLLLLPQTRLVSCKKNNPVFSHFNMVRSHDTSIFEHICGLQKR